MASFKVVGNPRIVYQQTTWEGVADFNGELIKWRHAEDDNGDEFIIFDEEDGWNTSDLIDPRHIAIYAAIGEYGNPEDWEPGDDMEIDDEVIEDYS